MWLAARAHSGEWIWVCAGRSEDGGLGVQVDFMGRAWKESRRCGYGCVCGSDVVGIVIYVVIEEGLGGFLGGFLGST